MGDMASDTPPPGTMGEVVPCCLPTFPSSERRQRRHQAILPVELSQLQYDRLKSVESQQDLILQTAWAFVLRCYTGSDEICFGYEDEIMVSKDPEDMPTSITCFRISHDEPISHNVRRDGGPVKVETRQRDGYVLFNTIFRINRDVVPLTSQPDTISLPENGSLTPPLDCRIRFLVETSDQTLRLSLEYWSDEVSLEHMSRVGKVLGLALDHVLPGDEDGDIDIMAGDLSLFTEEDHRRISQWNHSLPTTRDCCIHDVIREQCLQRPSKDAICAWDGTLTFAELDEQTSRLARHLQSQGVGPETRVPVCFDKSKWYTVAMIAILKAGGAFVPLDSSHPESRLQFLIQAVEATVVVCAPSHVAKLSKVAGAAPVIAFDDALLERCTDDILSSGADASNAAYIIFTSGSTGEPKGTLIEHRAFSSSSLAHSGPLILGPESRVLQFASHIFDASLVEILSALMNGATVCVPSEESRVNHLAEAINALQVNYITLTPSVIEFLDPSMIPAVETVILAGEAMSASQRNVWCQINLINGYGPTETSVSAAINSAVTENTDIKDIGFPVGGCCWIVDPQDHNTLVPVGAPGEMLVEGPSLARCYWNNAQKTAEAFIHNPSWAPNGHNRRFYKTGDMVRYNSESGALTYVGRKDTQVKLHGQRVELGEIESRLTADFDVQHALVHVPKSGYAKGKLATVLCLLGSHETSTGSTARELMLDKSPSTYNRIASLRQRLSSQLPTYMVPGVWLGIQALPLMTSGKLDRKKVTSWLDEIREDPGFESVEGKGPWQPMNETESQLGLIWSRVLNIPIDRLDGNESFLRLGGDSLAAMTCANRCRMAHMGLTVQDILRSSSIHDIALRVTSIQTTAAYEEKIDEPFDLSPIQHLHSVVRNEDQGYFNQSILTQLSKRINKSSLKIAVETLVNRHSMLRARFSHVGLEQKMKQQVTREIASSYRLQDHTVSLPGDVDAVVADSQQSIDCFKGPVLAVDLINIDGQRQLLSLVGHHLIVDIVSWRIILEELEELLLNPEEKSLPNSTMPFQIWCAKQAEQCANSCEESKSAPPDDLSFWGVDNPITYGDVECEVFEVDPESTFLILTGCHASLKTEPIDLLLACLLKSFSQAFPEHSVPVIHNEGHGREPWDTSIDISRTVGWFTSLYPVWVQGISENKPVQTLIDVKDMRRRAKDNGRALFAYRTLNQEGQERYPHPMPTEISFNYLGQNRDLQSESGLFSLANQMVGETREGGGSADFGRDTPRFALFEISAAVVSDQIRFTVSFSKSIQHRERVTAWISHCQVLLQTLPRQLLALPVTRTLSDFPLLTMDNDEFQSIKLQTLPRYGISFDQVEDIYPCTPIQQGILLSRCRNPDLYAVHATFEVQGEPKVDRLLEAWDVLTSHHSMLRTVFMERLLATVPFAQVVLKSADILPTQLACEDENQVLATFDSQPAIAYQIAHRFSICTTRQGNIFCRLELNHAAMDGGSISIILRDLRDAYLQILDEKPKPEFKDFVKYLQNQPPGADLEYWTSYLQSIQPCHFPTSAIEGTPQTADNLRTIRVNFSGFDRLNRFSKRVGITHSTVFNVAWGLVLSSLTSSDDVCFAFASSLRDVPVKNIESAVGPLMNLIVCRMKLPPTATIMDTLQRAQKDYVECIPHLSCSLIDIQHGLKLANTSLFNSGVSYRKMSKEQTSSDSPIQFVQKGLIHDPAETEVYINIEAMDDSCEIEMNYWTACLTDKQAGLAAEAFLAQIDNIMDNEFKSLKSLHMMSDEQKAQFPIVVGSSTAKYLAEISPCYLPAFGIGFAEHCVSSEHRAIGSAAELHAFCVKNDIAESSIFELAWGLVLRLYCGITDVCFGSLLSDTVARLGVCKVAVDDNTSITDALHQLEGRKHVISYLKMLQAGIEPPFNTVVCVDSSSSGDRASALQMMESGLFSTTLHGCLTSKSGTIEIYYSSKSVSKPYIDSMMDSLEYMLGQIPETGPTRLIGDLDFVDDSTCLQLQSWNSGLPTKVERCAHEVILERVQSSPSAPAICAWDGGMTYSELYTLSTRLAYHLRQLGVRKGTIVALLFDKSAYAVVAQLAVLQAGGAFCSLDPLHAQGRLQLLVKEIEPRIMLCSRSHYVMARTISKLAYAVDQISLDDLPDPVPVEWSATVSPSDAAYAIFTSGTTGTPKATVVEHASLTTSAKAWAEIVGFNSDTRTFQFSSFTFDVSVMDIFFTLLGGGCICIPSEIERMNDIAGAIRRQSANLFSGVPSLVNTLDPQSIPTMKTLCMGGEKMSQDFLDKWSDRRVVNAYGPSEATVIATTSLKSDGEGNIMNSDPSDIGTALSGRSWVVDPGNFHRLLPCGAIGELLLEGCNVARGYLNNKLKTQLSFVSDPEWAIDPRLQNLFGQKERMYLTGDLVRYKPDGALSFLNRADTQIKLHGQRVELEEIEHHCTALLSSLGSMLEPHVVVDLVTPRRGTVSLGLAAFFLSPIEEGEAACGDNLLLSMTASRRALAETLRTELPHHLPQYMIPRFFFPVQSLPRTASSKIDRARLKGAVESLIKEEMKPYMIAAAPRRQGPAGSRLESTLFRLWEQVMKLTPGSVSGEDNFFGLGGDSFAAMRLVSAAQLKGLSLTVSNIFTHPVATDMAQHCESEGEGKMQAKANTPVEPYSLIQASVDVDDVDVNVDLDEVLNEVAEVCGVRVSSIADVYPCSAVQEGLITSSTLQHQAYVIRSVYRLGNSVDLEQFKVAWQKTVDELAILRTRIVHTAAANFCQAVLSPTAIEWTLRLDLPSAAESLPALPSQHGGPLAQYTIAYCKSSWYFVWSMHHAVYDAQSVRLVLDRAQANYLESVASPAVPYNLFIDYLMSCDVVEADRFWLSYLSEFSTPSFPLVKDSAQASAGERLYTSVDLCRTRPNTDVTLPVMIRAAWALVLAQQTGSQDVCFGETLSGRNINLAGVSEIAGPLLTTVPVRIQVDKQMSIKSYLQKINKEMIEMISHQHLGIQRIRKLNPGTSAGCDFQNILVLQSDDQTPEDNLWEVIDVQASEGFFTYPLVVECKLLGDQIKTTTHYNEQVLSAQHVGIMMDQLHSIVKQLVEMPKHEDPKVETLYLISPADKQRVATWNEDRLPPVEKTINDLVWQQCVLQPDSQAICAWDGTLSYAQMCQYSSAFARYLVSQEAGPEMFIPVCMDKSAWMVVALLGILAAGAAYVPLDPAHPTSRHEEILADIDAHFLICSPQYQYRYAGKVNHIISVDQTMLQSIPTSSCPESRASGSNAAYVLFTSGSTGRPKGIVTEHASLVSSVMAFGPAVHLQRGTRAFHFASLTFDAAVMEIFGSLVFGGCVCIPSEEERLNHVSGAMDRMDVSWTFCTPSVAAIIEPSSVPSLKTLVCGGEMISADVISKWCQHVTLINGYGPTETSVFATLNTQISKSTQPDCIGRGIKATCTWVIDPDNHDRLVPVGAVGELCLSGRPLAREYLKNPEKTAMEFIDNPQWASDFPGTSSNRIYKTGDLVRYYPDGSIKYIGRKDHQVKLHGQRMELGEIEARLRESHSVRQAVVLLPKVGLFKGRLVAMLSPNDALCDTRRIISTTACRLVDEDVWQRTGLLQILESAESKMPMYMVPQAWIVVESFPMLVSGKIDRKHITAWVEQIDKSTYEHVMQEYDNIRRVKNESVSKPKNTAVTAVDILQQVCAKVLDISLETIAVERSFISLGGDSITGMAVVSHARKQGLVVRLQDVIQAKSVMELSRLAKFNAPKPTRVEETLKPFPLSPIQKLYFQSSIGHGGSSRFNQSITVRLGVGVEFNTLQKAIHAIVNRHGMLRARFGKSPEGVWQQRITKEVESSYKLRTHHIEHSQGIKSISSETQNSLDIANGPILGVDLFNIEGKDQVIFLVACHLCIDMVSWRVILQDLEEFLQGGSVASEQPLSFQAWRGMNDSNVSREISQGPMQDLTEPNDIAYWGARELKNTYGQVKTKSFTLDEQTTGMVLGRLHEAIETDPLDLLLAASFRSFSRTFTDRVLPVIYNESHGRQLSAESTVDSSGSVGWFTELQPLYFPSCSDGIIDTMQSLKRSRQSLQNSPTPFSYPLPLEIMFNYLGRFQQLERQDSLFQQYGGVFEEEDISLFGDMGPNTARFALFEVTAIVLREKLQVSFTFNKNLQHQEKIANWIAAFEWELRESVAQLSSGANEQQNLLFRLLPATHTQLQQLMTQTLPALGITDQSNIEDIYPCAPVQEGILLSQLRDPDSYIFHAIFEVTDNKSGRDVDTKMLVNAWQQVTRRHPILRTIFVESNYKNGTFDQVVLKSLDLDVMVLECDNTLALERLGAIKLRDANMRRSPQIPHQITVCRTTTGQVLLKMEINHALIDGGSVAIISRDFAAAYGHELSSYPGPLFSEYIRYLRAIPLQDSMAYWTHYLQGIRPCHLPASPTLGGHSKKLNSLKVNFDRFDELQELCLRESITFANLILAAWALVLRSLTFRDDVSFGYLCAGRDAPVTDIQDAVGVFINMICCRVQFSQEQDFVDIMRKVQSDHFDSLPHQETSLAQIQNQLGLSNMLFNTTVSIQNRTPSRGSTRDALSFEVVEVHDPSEFPMTVNVVTEKGNEGIMLRYWSDSFSDDQAQSISMAIVRVFEDSLECPSISNSTASGSPKQGIRTPDSHTPLYDIHELIDSKALHKLIDDRVHEILAQILGHQTPRLMLPATVLTPSRTSSHDLTTHRDFLDGNSDTSAHVDESAEYHIPEDQRQDKPFPDLKDRLYDLWSAALEIPVSFIKPGDSFFRVGGDSIKAMKMASAAREQGLLLGVSDIFRHSSFEEMLDVITRSSVKAPDISVMAAPVATAIKQTEAESRVSDLQRVVQKERDASVYGAVTVDPLFLQHTICPRIGISEDGVADILPVNDFQTMSLTAQQFNSRWMLNYFYLESTGPLDLDRLRESCSRVIASFDVLRSVFVCYGNHFYQVVLKQLKVDLSVHHGVQSLDAFTAGLQSLDREKPLKQGEPFVKFFVARKANSDQHRILIRLSHAQYDGVCLSKLLNAIKQGYEGGTLPLTSSFASHMRLMSSMVTQEHHEYYVSLLKGSKMPQVIRRNGPNTYQYVGSSVPVTRKVEISGNGNITIATIVQAAWALTLAKMTAQSDVVFGLTVNGRNANVPGIASAVGPCVNMIPVRVRFGENWNALDLFRFIQDQQIASMPYENMGFRDILRNCTDWPKWSYFSTSVFHQSVPYEGHIQLDDNNYRIGGVGVMDNLSDLSLVSSPISDTEFSLALYHSEKGPINSAFASRILNMTCDAIESLTASAGAVLPSPTTLQSLLPHYVDDIPRPSDEQFLSSHLKEHKIADLLLYSGHLTRAWKQVVQPKRTDGFQLDTSFFSLDGDLFSMAQVAVLLQQDGLKVHLEDLLEHPTFLGQLAVLALYNEVHIDTRESPKQ